jgi:hypothetical protein
MSLSGTTVEVPQTGMGLYIGNFEALIELSIVALAGPVVLAICATLAYIVSTSARLKPCFKCAFLVSQILGVLVMPFLVLSVYGPMLSLVATFTMSVYGILGVFRLLELACGTGPKGFDTSLGRFALYVGIPSELMFDGDGNTRQASWQFRKESFKNLAAHGLLQVCVLSIGRSCDFKPWLPDAVDPIQMHLLGFPKALPAMHLQAFLVYAQLATSLQLFRVASAVIGFEAHDAMRQPLMLSTSVRDFWGRRWNLLIHRLMHRSFFTPLASRPWPLGPRAGAIAAFLVSGIFHEYMWLLVNWYELDYVPGGPLKFFCGAVCVVDNRELVKADKDRQSCRNPSCTIVDDIDDISDPAIRTTLLAGSQWCEVR